MTEPQQSQQPQQIGKYPVVRHLGSGATSEVYLCHDPFTERAVAVKLVSAALFNDPDRGKLYRKLFVTEASLAGKMQHPHICQIFDAVADDDLPSLVGWLRHGGTFGEFTLSFAFRCSLGFTLGFGQSKFARLHLTIENWSVSLEPMGALHFAMRNAVVRDNGGSRVAASVVVELLADRADRGAFVIRSWSSAPTSLAACGGSLLAIDRGEDFHFFLRQAGSLVIG